MAFRGMKIASLLAVAGLAGVAAVAWYRLPPGTRLPMHWNAAGTVDRWGDAGSALFTPVGVAAIIATLMAGLPKIEPLQPRLQHSAPLYRTAWAAGLGLMALVEAAVAAPAFHVSVPATLAMAGSGLALIAVGNVLPKSRPSFFVGIRTPWTLTDPENWIATHRLGSRTMIAGGAVVVLAAFVPLELRRPLMLCALALCLVPVPYSWWLWHRAAA